MKGSDKWRASVWEGVRNRGVRAVKTLDTEKKTDDVGLNHGREDRERTDLRDNKSRINETYWLIKCESKTMRRLTPSFLAWVARCLKSSKSREGITLIFWHILSCCGSCHPFSLTISWPTYAFHQHLREEHGDIISVNDMTMGNVWMDAFKRLLVLWKGLLQPSPHQHLTIIRQVRYFLSPNSCFRLGEKTLQRYLPMQAKKAEGQKTSFSYP